MSESSGRLRCTALGFVLLNKSGPKRDFRDRVFNLVTIEGQSAMNKMGVVVPAYCCLSLRRLEPKPMGQ
jgi:hypothetical protein